MNTVEFDTVTRLANIGSQLTSVGGELRLLRLLSDSGYTDMTADSIVSVDFSDDMSTLAVEFTYTEHGEHTGYVYISSNQQGRITVEF